MHSCKSALRRIQNPKNATKRRSSTKPTLPAIDFTPKKYEGPSLPELLAIRNRKLSPTLTTYYNKPLAIHQGHKQWVFDLNGRRYLDMFGGICTISVGHSHPKVTEAVTEQMQTLSHISNVYLHPKIHEYAEKLTDKLPDDLKVVYFCNSGSEATELAILLARTYTRNFDIIALRNGYHGTTYHAMTLTGSNLYKQPVPSAPGFHHVKNPDVYKGAWGGANCRHSPVQPMRTCTCVGHECRAGEQYVKEVAELLEHSIPKGRLAGFCAESIQGIGGVVQYPKNYLKDVARLVRANGGVVISDEVQSGFGRTGEHFWGFEMHGIQPDIVTMAKGIGNGFPLAAVVTTPEIAQSLTSAMHFNTFGGNAVACAAGIAVLDIIEEEQLQANSHHVGTYLLKELAALREEFAVVGDVRGKGLMIGIEFIKGDGQTSPLHPEHFMRLWELCLDAGLIVGKGYGTNVFRIKPPMCVTKEDADFTVAAIRRSLETLYMHYNPQDSVYVSAL